MMLEFYKMTSTDHDFVMVDNRDLAFSRVLSSENIKDICNRRFGVGADGLIVVEPTANRRVVRMHHYNAAGGEAEMSADAALCFTAFVDFLLEGNAKKIRFESAAGAVNGQVNADDSVTATTSTETYTGPALIVFRGEVIICDE